MVIYDNDGVTLWVILSLKYYIIVIKIYFILFSAFSFTSFSSFDFLRFDIAGPSIHFGLIVKLHSYR